MKLLGEKDRKIREKNTIKNSEKTLENSEIFSSLLSLGNPPQ